MFDITHVNSFMELVSNPDKYKTYLDELTKRTAEWKDTLGAADTLAKAASKLSEAEITLESAKKNADKLKQKASALVDKAEKQTSLTNERIKELDERSRKLDVREQDLQARMMKVNGLMEEAKQENLLSAQVKEQLAGQQHVLKQMQLELSTRLDRLKEVMQ